MAHAQKPDFVFRRNGRVHLNRRGPQFNRLLAAEVYASAVVRLDVPRKCEGYWLPNPFTSFPFTSPPVRHRVPSHFNWTLPPAWCCGEWVGELRFTSRWNCKVTSFICSHLWTGFVCRNFSCMLVSLYLLRVTNLIYVPPIQTRIQRRLQLWDYFFDCSSVWLTRDPDMFQFVVFFLNFCHYFMLRGMLISP